MSVAMDARERATRVWSRPAGLGLSKSRLSRGKNDLAIDIIAGAIRSAQHELLIEAAEFVLSGEPIEIARKLRERARIR
jgi:phosphatidylserine/phosphatidylglycerophosphate/cardiolipin synthase-like enzyme